MKKLILMYPNQRWLKDDVVTTWTLDPRTLGVMAAVVRDIVDVKIVDAQIHDMSEEMFKSVIVNYKPDYVGISLLTSEYAHIMDRAAAIVKQANPNIVVIAGGVHVTVNYDKVILNHNIDYACRGEGEYFLRELILFLEGKGGEVTKGLVYLDESGSMIAQEKASVDNLEALPWPAYDLMDFEIYTNSMPRYGSNRYPELPGLSMIITRGCPYDCTFCQVETISGRTVRMRDPEDVIEELKFLKQRYGIRSMTFFDDNFLLPKTKMKKFLKLMIDSNLKLKWQAAGTSIWVLDDEFIELMQASGCTLITVALESGSERVLHEIIRKPIKHIERVPNIISKVHAKGIWVCANFIIGSPGETWDEIQQTIKYAETCGADYVKFYVAVPLRGTEMYEMAKKMNVFTVPEDQLEVDWRYSQIKSDEWTPKDVSVLRVYEWDRINFSTDRAKTTADIWGLSMEELNIIRKRTRDSLSLC